MPLFAVQYSYTDATIDGRDTHRPAHRAWLAELFAAGTLVSSGPYPDGSGALILVTGSDLQSVTALFAEDPFAQHELLESSRVVEWRPVMGAFTDA